MTERPLEELLDQARQYAVVVLPGEHDPFVAQAADFPGAVGVGQTRDEAAEELVNGIASILELADEMGVKVPPPMRGYTGSVSVRLPRTLHSALVQRAEAEGLSLNATISYLLAQSLQLEGITKLPKRRSRASAPAA